MMHWILQTNLFQEKEWDTLVSTLERFSIPYSIHKVIPFIGQLVPDPEPLHAKVVCFGSYSMRHSAKKFAWSPGVYDLEPMSFPIQLEKWGKLMLNSRSAVCRFEDAAITEPAFIRPIEDSKHFAGKVFDVDEFHEWKTKVVVLEEDTGSSLTKNTLIQIAPLKEIYSEYRYWIVGGRIVTRSMYKRGDRVFYSSEVDQRFDDFVMTCIKIWQPHRAFVIDVCDTSDGLMIVEINTINSAGFYAGEVASIVMALEELEN